MLKGILGKKLGTTRLFLEEGKAVSVTIVEAGPCRVVQKKSGGKNGQESLQLGFGTVKPKALNKPELGHLKKGGLDPLAHLKEFPVADAQQYQVGDEVRVGDVFQIGEKVKVTATSKGKGFAGVVKRWGFSGGKETHGTTSHRVPGSIGSSAYPSRVIKGKKLPGHLGNRQVTVKNLSVVDIRPDQNLLILKGAIPGSRNNLIVIWKE